MSDLIERLEMRRLMNIDPPVVDLRADTNRDGRITSGDNVDEQFSRRARGSLVLPNLDRDNTTSIAPDAWAGGNWNGSYVGPNNVIDNADDLKDMARIRLAKFVNVDSSYSYVGRLRLLKSGTDSSYYADTAARDRVRVFMPGGDAGRGRMVPTAGDQALMGPGLFDEIVFKYEPTAPNELPVSLLHGSGFLEFAVEGLKPGAGVRFEWQVRYEPVVAFSSIDPLPDQSVTLTDVVEMRVSPFVVQGNRDRISDRTGSIYMDVGLFAEENAAFRNSVRQLFGDRSVESDSADLWMQDGAEIGYASSPQGSMNLVMELPRSIISYSEGGQRRWIREKLIGPGVGIFGDLSTIDDNSSAYGGDIETMVDPTDPDRPGVLLRSQAMPQALKDFFDAQAVQRVIEIDPDAFLGVGHVDELAFHNSTGDRVFTPDVELGWAMLLLTSRFKYNATMLHGTSEFNDDSPVWRRAGTAVSEYLNSSRLKYFNFEKINAAGNLPEVHRRLAEELDLTPEVSTPVGWSGNTGSASLVRGGVFTQLMKNQTRYVEVTFLDTDRYEVRTRVAGKTWSARVEGRKSRDEVFPELGVYLLQSQWSSGASAAGDRFTFQTNVDASLVRLPNLYISTSTFADFGDTPEPEVLQVIAAERGISLFTNSVNSVVDGTRILTGETYGPKVNWSGGGRSDILRDYVLSAFRRNGFAEVVFVDSRTYTLGSGGVHCGINTIRDVSQNPWWASSD
jgi:hypothetical protein